MLAQWRGERVVLCNAEVDGPLNIAAMIAGVPEDTDNELYNILSLFVTCVTLKRCSNQQPTVHTYPPIYDISTLLATAPCLSTRVGRISE